MKSVRTKIRTQDWFDGDVLNCIQSRDKAYKDFKKSNNAEDYSIYKKLRNKAQYVIKKAKVNYYKHKIQEDQRDSKSLWKTLKNLGTSNTLKTKCCNIGLKINDIVNFDCKIVTDHFNKFFTTIATKLVEKLPRGTGKYGKKHVFNYYKSKGVKSNSFQLQPATIQYIKKQLSKLRGSKATGLDKLPAKFLKDGANSLAAPISHIVNLSIKTCKVPLDLKSAKVVPIYKKGCKNEAGNYQPVSILSIVSKIIERTVYDQLNAYLKKRKYIV